MENCIYCYGTGQNPQYKDFPCGFCKGTGKVAEGVQWAKPVVPETRRRRIRILGRPVDDYITWGAIALLLWGLGYIIWA